MRARSGSRRRALGRRPQCGRCGGASAAAELGLHAGHEGGPLGLGPRQLGLEVPDGVREHPKVIALALEVQIPEGTQLRLLDHRSPLVMGGFPAAGQYRPDAVSEEGRCSRDTARDWVARARTAAPQRLPRVSRPRPTAPRLRIPDVPPDARPPTKEPPVTLTAAEISTQQFRIVFRGYDV